MTESERKWHADYIADNFKKFGNASVTVHPDIVMTWPEVKEFRLKSWYPIKENNIFADQGGVIPKSKNRKKKGDDWWAMWVEKI